MSLRISHLIAAVLVVLVCFSSFAHTPDSFNASADRKWPGFWRQFSEAINKKDVATIRKMMPPDFFDGGGGGTPSEWLQFISDNEQKGSWRNLQRSIARGTVKHRKWSSKGIPTRVTKDNGYYFEFRKDRWYFAGVVGD